MRLLLLFGPPAVGKMTVGQAVARRTGLRLFHNHVTIDLLLPYFPYGSPAFARLNRLFRQHILEEVARSELPGLIFTFVWDFDDPRNWADVQALCALYEGQGAQVSLVELSAPIDVRVIRNGTPLRLAHKPAMQDRESAHGALLALERRQRMNSREGELAAYRRYLRIDNTDLDPEAAAERILTAFGWAPDPQPPVP